MPPRQADRPPPLRAYQLEAARAILRSVRSRHGDTLVVEVSRQGGKNELSARVEAALLTASRIEGGSIVKAAPTEEPQLRTSFQRLTDTLRRDNIKHRAGWPDVHVGAATLHFRSGQPTANVAGATASLLLEIDEAQDFDADTYQRRFRPMAATTNATTVLYGTAWSETDLLQTTIAANRELELADGRRRNFIYPAAVVGALLPAYARFVAAERARLGPSHPLIQTEFDLIPLTGAGRLFTAAQLSLLTGSHASLAAPLLADTYVASLDVGGEDTGSARLNDRTVLMLGRQLPPSQTGRAGVELVACRTSRGAQHADTIASIAAALKQWRVHALTVDATGIGESTASLLARAVPGLQVEPFKFTQSSKSTLGYDLIAAANTGAARIFTDDGEHFAHIMHELAAARRDIRPNQTMAFYVPEDLGNDDYLIALALLVRAAQHHSPRFARMA